MRVIIFPSNTWTVSIFELVELFLQGRLAETVIRSKENQVKQLKHAQVPVFTLAFLSRLSGALDRQPLNKTSNACQSTAGNWSPQTGSFPQSTDAQHANFPSECNLYRNRESVCWSVLCVCDCVRLGGAVEKTSQGEGPCSRPGNSSQLAGRCQEAAFLHSPLAW